MTDFLSSATELITALEKATGPDRRLDARIALTTDAPETLKEWWRGYLNQPDSDYPFKDKIPAYTASIDAAMTLQTAGWFVSVTQMPQSWLVQLTNSNSKSVTATAATEPLARSLASLKARAALEGTK